MFTVEEDQYDSLKVKVEEINSNYLISSDDYINVSVYTSNGEMLLDPEKQYFQGQNNMARSDASSTSSEINYLVDVAGFVNLPMVGRVKVDSLTLYQADSLLAIKYSVFYEQSYIKTAFANRRVTLLGAMGNQVIPLENENMTLLEVLGFSKAVNFDFKASNIKLIRGDLKNPEVEVIDLSTIEGMKRANLKMQNHDVIYVEPGRRLFSQSMREVTPVFTLLSSVFTLLLIISNTAKK